MIERDKLAGAFSLGLGRAPLAGVAPLPALAMLGQAGRFAPPVVPEREALAWRLPEDATPVLGPRGRRAVLRLARLDLAGLLAVIPVLPGHLAAAGRRLHPFDLPLLAKVLSWNFGPVERAWLARHGAEAPTAHPVLRADWAVTRETLKEEFQNAPARRRQAIVADLGYGLSDADRAFLEQCRADRAAPVKQAAEQLLARLAGALPVEESGFFIERQGLMRKRRLVFKPPLVAGERLKLWQALERVGVRALMAGLDIAEDELPGLMEDDELRLAFICRLHEGSFGPALAERLSLDLDQAQWPRDVESLSSFRLPSDEMRAMAKRMLLPRSTIGGKWGLGAQIGGPLDIETARRLLGHAGWAAYLVGLADGKVDPDLVLKSVATLMPAEALAGFQASLAGIAPERLKRTGIVIEALSDLADGDAP